MEGKTNVILYGEEPVKMWKALEPVPGDNIILEHPVAYVKTAFFAAALHHQMSSRSFTMQNGLRGQTQKTLLKWLMTSSRGCSLKIYQMKESNYGY